MPFDFAILDYLQTLRTPALDAFFSAITHLGDAGCFWIALTILLLIFPKTRRCGMVAALSLIMEVIICNGVLKPLVARIRPYDVNTMIELIVRAPKDYSFPSGHTAASFAAAAAYWTAGNRKLAVPCLVIAALIAFSRLYLYIHYPTDVLAGAVLGVILAIAAAKIYEGIEKKRKQ